jgi:hypothetical protein
MTAHDERSAAYHARRELGIVRLPSGETEGLDPREPSDCPVVPGAFVPAGRLRRHRSVRGCAHNRGCQPVPEHAVHLGHQCALRDQLGGR